MRLRALLLGLVFFVVAAAVVTIVYPPVDDLWVENPYWNGLSEFYREVKPVRVHSLGELGGYNPRNTTLFIIGPSRGFTAEEINAINNYLEAGGRVVVLDEVGSGNVLLRGLRLETRFNGSLLRDSVFFYPSPEFPQATNEVLEKAVVLNYATVLSLREPYQVLLESGLTSYLADGRNISGPFPVAALLGYGEGELVLVSDSSIWLNSMIDHGANKALLGELLRGGALIDVGHSYPTLLLSLKWRVMSLYQLFKVAEFRYLLALSVSLAIYRAFKLKKDRNEVEEALKRHPDWNKEELEILYNWKEKRT